MSGTYAKISGTPPSSLPAFPLLFASCVGVPRLLQLMTLHIHAVNFDKCLITCVHLYRVIQNSFTVLSMPRALPSHSSFFLALQFLVTTHHFTVPNSASYTYIFLKLVCPNVWRI